MGDPRHRRGRLVADEREDDVAPAEFDGEVERDRGRRDQPRPRRSDMSHRQRRRRRRRAAKAEKRVGREPRPEASTSPRARTRARRRHAHDPPPPPIADLDDTVEDAHAELMALEELFAPPSEPVEEPVDEPAPEPVDRSGVEPVEGSDRRPEATGRAPDAGEPPLPGAAPADDGYAPPAPPAAPDEVEHDPGTAAGEEEPATAEPTPVALAPSQTPPPAEATRRGGLRWLLVVILGLGAVASLVLLGLQFGWLDLARDIVAPPATEADREPPEDGWQPALLLASVDGQGSPGELRSLAVLATDRREDRATVLLIPTSTITDVPGFGSFTLREAWELGGSSLVAVTVDNLLGLRIDGILVLDADGWASWFEATGGAAIDVPSRLVPQEGGGETGFEPGSQLLDPASLGRYVLLRGEGESELDLLPRTRQVLTALLEAIDADPEVLDAAIEAARTFPGTATPDRVRTVLGELAEARQRDELTTLTLPVVPLGSGEQDLYRSDDERLEALMDDRFAASRDDLAASERHAVQILNGNGRPGVGQEVAERLADGRYRIVLTGNADRFTYETTRIIVFTEEREHLEAAQDVQERLGGIGTIERSGTPQSVVDLTIVVGADFPPDG